VLDQHGTDLLLEELDPGRIGRGGGRGKERNGAGTENAKATKRQRASWGRSAVHGAASGGRFGGGVPSGRGR
jgi:hypothetical protein